MLSGPAKTILVVDDEKEMTQLLKIELGQEGYKVSTANNGEEGLRQVEAAKPDLIILDIMMPGMDGYEVLGALKKDEATSGIPVIILTAKIQEKDIQDGIKLGADLYITKPFDSAKLINGIRVILAGK